MSETTSDTIQKKPEVASITSFDQINNIIKRKEISYASHYMIPSLKKAVPFNEINTSQQKRLVKSVIDSPIYNTEFIYTLREIIKENCQDSSIVVDDFTLIDKLVLALAFRIKSIGSMIDIEVKTKQDTSVKVSLDASRILDIALETLQDLPPQEFEDNYFKIECSLPTIGAEFRFEKELRNRSKSIEIENIEELRQTVGDAFIGEIVKYISNVSVKSESDEVIPIDWKKFSFTERIKVIETFKTGLLKEIIGYINNVQKQVDKIELVSFEFGGEHYERRMTIDGNFFTIS